MRETALDLRYNIVALTIAICSDEFVLPEKAFSIIEDKTLGIDDADIEDMLKMKAKGVTYRQMEDIYGVHVDVLYGRIRRYKDKKRPLRRQSEKVKVLIKYL